MPITAIVFLFVFFSECAGTGTVHASDVARSWDDARVYIPGRDSFYRPSDGSVPTGTLPTVLHLHGCTGIWSDPYAAILVAAGYAVVMTDSFARRNRPRDCDSRTQQGGLFPRVQEVRYEEIGYALERLRSLPWVDVRNIFLMGHSEGGGAAALWDKPGFKGHIVLAWTCTHRLRPAWDGLRVPAEIPVLAINFEFDPWFPPGNPMHGNCESKFGQRKNASEVILKGSGHNTVTHTTAQEAVLQFLRTHTVR